MARAILAAVLGTVFLIGTAAGAIPDTDYVESMAREHAGDTPAPGAAADGPPAEAMHAGFIEYNGMRGYLAQPVGEARAGLIVIHEWWGLNDNIREMSNRLAAAGYVALAVDLYDGKVAADSEEARALMAAAMDDPQRLDEQLRSAFYWLRAEGGVTRIGSLGWCFGGALSLRTAMLLPEELDAAVIYYGRVVTESARLAPLMMPILGIFGGEDRGIPVESVLAFETALQALGKTAEIVIYPRADHAFANPSGTRYAPEAAADAWRRTLEFLAEHLQ